MLSFHDKPAQLLTPTPDAIEQATLTCVDSKTDATRQIIWLQTAAMLDYLLCSVRTQKTTLVSGYMS